MRWHLEYIWTTRFQVYTCNFGLSTLDSSLFLSYKLFREEKFLGSKHLCIFQCIQLGFFFHFLLVFLTSHWSLRLWLRVSRWCLSLMYIDWCAGWFPCSARWYSSWSCLGKWASLFLRLWSRHGTLKIGFSVTYTTAFCNSTRWLFQVGVSISIATIACVLQRCDVPVRAPVWVSCLEDRIIIGFLVVFGHHRRRVSVCCFIAWIVALFEFRWLWLFVGDVIDGLINRRATVVIDIDFNMELPFDVRPRWWNFTQSVGCHGSLICWCFISVNFTEWVTWVELLSLNCNFSLNIVLSCRCLGSIFTQIHLSLLCGSNWVLSILLGHEPSCFPVLLEEMCHCWIVSFWLVSKIWSL